jgi:hypothetical protein
MYGPHMPALIRFPTTGTTVVCTLGGRHVDLADPHPEDIDLDDVAQALAHQPGFAGHIARPYSQAEHTLLVCDLVARTHPGHDGLIEAALHHDTYAAYTGPIPAPAALAFGDEFNWTVGRLKRAIAARLGFDVALFGHPAIARANEHARLLEAARLCPHEAWDWSRPDGIAPQAPDDVQWVGGLDAQTAREAWLRLAYELQER